MYVCDHTCGCVCVCAQIMRQLEHWTRSCPRAYVTRAPRNALSYCAYVCVHTCVRLCVQELGQLKLFKHLRKVIATCKEQLAPMLSCADINSICGPQRSAAEQQRCTGPPYCSSCTLSQGRRPTAVPGASGLQGNVSVVLFDIRMYELI